MNLKQFLKAPPAQSYVKNSSGLVSILFIIGGVIYYPTKGYGTIAALIAALLVLLGQKLLLAQTNRDFADMQQAKTLFQSSQNPDYLRFIEARASQMLRDNKVLSSIGKQELQQLLDFTQQHLSNKQ